MDGIERKYPNMYPDEKILKLIKYLKFKDIIKTEKEFCEDISILRQTLYKIRKGESSFTVAHLESICKKYNVNGNWIFGTQNHVFNSANSIETKDLL